MTTTDPRFAALGARPGKIVAVHLSYASRAEQRGRRPAAPSYFLKPSSSLAPSDAVIERPAGTELLAFEGEIALVIGEPARWVTTDTAWSHVASLTAANDFGLYDLRANDKGSNVRSKGGDGFTPLGPTLIDARDVDPAAVRLRTWVNGELVQDDSTAGLLFPLAQIVADRVSRIPGSSGPIDLDGCRNPTFAPGDTAADNVLLRTAPMPPDSDRHPGPAPRADEVDGANVSATVAASDLFQLTAPASTSIDFGDLGRGGGEVARSLGRFSVVDDRNRLGGWSVQFSVSDFVGIDDAAARVSSTFLGIAPHETTHQDGVSIAGGQEAGQAVYPMILATGEPGTTTTLVGATFDADLSLRIPRDAAVGRYRSTVTLTLIGL